MESLLAYLDPGSGSIILQALLGGIAGMVVALKLFGRRALEFLRIGKQRSDDVKTVTDERDAL